MRRQRFPLAKRYRQRVESLKGTLANSGRTVTLGPSLDGFMTFLFGGDPPGNLYGYQEKRLTKFAFRKCMILKEMSLARQNGKKEKGELCSRTSNAVIYEDKYGIN